MSEDWGCPRLALVAFTVGMLLTLQPDLAQQLLEGSSCVWCPYPKSPTLKFPSYSHAPLKYGVRCDRPVLTGAWSILDLVHIYRLFCPGWEWLSGNRTSGSWIRGQWHPLFWDIWAVNWGSMLKIKMAPERTHLGLGLKQRSYHRVDGRLSLSAREGCFENQTRCMIRWQPNIKRLGPGLCHLFSCVSFKLPTLKWSSYSKTMFKIIGGLCQNTMGFVLTLYFW